MSPSSISFLGDNLARPVLYLPSIGQVDDPAVQRAFEQLLIWAGSFTFPAASTYAETTLTANGNISTLDSTIYLAKPSVTALTITTPAAPGGTCSIYNATAGSITVTPSSGSFDAVGILTLTTFTGAIVFSDGTNWYTLGKG